MAMLSTETTMVNFTSLAARRALGRTKEAKPQEQAAACVDLHQQDGQRHGLAGEGVDAHQRLEEEQDAAVEDPP